MAYKHIFFDLDHTLWDFDTNARLTLAEMHVTMKLAERGVHDFDLFHRNYLVHNEKLWARYRNGYIKQQELRYKRMWLSLLDFKIADEALARKMAEDFLEMLPTRTALFPYTVEILTYLRNKNYQLHLITNGFNEVQQHKLNNSGLTPYFVEVITSESSNSLKPNAAIFEYAIQKTKARTTESIMIGDSLEADIQGAMDYGMDQVFVNHTNLACTILPTYTVKHLKELEEIF